VDSIHPRLVIAAGGLVRLPVSEPLTDHGSDVRRAERTGDSLAAVMAAIVRHRHRTARLLDGLHDLERAAESEGALPSRRSRIDVGTLASHLVGRLRREDLRLGRLAAELDGTTPPTVRDQPREE
jgi:hypothetical protein